MTKLFFYKPYIAGLVIFGTIFSLILLAKSKIEQPISYLAPEKEFEDEPFDRFRLKGVSQIIFNDNYKCLSIKADKIIHRKRTSEFFTYYNLKEIYISDLRIESYPEEQLLQGKSGLLELSFKDISHGLSPMMRVPFTSEDYLDNLDTESNILTRIVIERLFVTMNLRKGAKAVISSEKAFINLRGVTFQGHFSLTSSDGKNLTALMAIWLRDSEGIYFPDGYLLQAKGVNQRGTRGTFIIDQNGRLLKSHRRPPRNISSLDWLDEAEADFQNLLLQHIIQRIPSFNKTISSLVSPGARGNRDGQGNFVR